MLRDHPTHTHIDALSHRATFIRRILDLSHVDLSESSVANDIARRIAIRQVSCLNDTREQRSSMSHQRQNLLDYMSIMYASTY